MPRTPKADPTRLGLTEGALRALIRDRKGLRVVAEVIGHPGGFVAEFRYEDQHRVLFSTRDEVRVFPNLTKLAVLLRKIGLARFRVDSSKYKEGLVRAPRPDRSRALKRAQRGGNGWKRQRIQGARKAPSADD